MNARLTNVRIDMNGHPRLMANLDLTNEPELERLSDEGKLSLSTAFYCDNYVDEDDWNLHINGKVFPHHVLFFVESEEIQPGDKGSFILNTKKVDDMDDSIKTRLLKVLGMPGDYDEVMAKNVQYVDEIRAMKEKELALNAASSAKDEEIERLQTSLRTLLDDTEENKKEVEEKATHLAAVMAELDKLKEDHESANTQIATFVQKEKDQCWAEFKEHLPPGFVHGDREVEARAKFEANDPQFHIEIQEFKDAQKSTNVEGEIVPESVPEPAKRGTTIGVWDARKNAYV
jgi:hypothetical protein